MKVLSFHPFSLYSNGGGSRILRRLYEGKEDRITSLVVLENWSMPEKGKFDETIIYASPVTRKWMRWYLRTWITWLRQRFFKSYTISQIRKTAKNFSYDIIHAVQHGPFAAALCDAEFCKGKLLWVSFHDHYTTTHTTKKDADKLWNNADRRLVISDEYGKEYQKLFGNLPYEIITDGVAPDEINTSSATIETPVLVYFAGLLHMGYVPLFKVLAVVLDSLTNQGFAFKLLLRGTQRIDFLNNRKFEVEYLPLSFNDTELKAELNSASILYLPIKFTDHDFYLYSLSTKMVGYLGAKGAILYHGPSNSAACQLLQKADCAVCCTSLNETELEADIKSLLNNKVQISQNAKSLAQKQFDLTNIQNRFWQA